jgi:hypothetical protein
MTADYNGWADRPEDEREAEEAAEELFAVAWQAPLRPPPLPAARSDTPGSLSPR